MYSFKYRQRFGDLLNGLKMENIYQSRNLPYKTKSYDPKLLRNHNGQINLSDYFIADENEVAKSYVNTLKV